ncbi:hypothetical protein [Arthrobacter sp. H14]|uniref:hypothetical protein n=1 Tax=Arthrobacter sp. H14 TaxID=1312959 RepID=UPI0004B0A396|nr:hypothetical protein [Arthrobacter sp. H14]
MFTKPRQIMKAIALSIALGSITASTMSPAVALETETQAAIVKPALQPCVDLAVKQKHQQWVCTGQGMTIQKNAKGKTVDGFVPLETQMPEIKELTDIGFSTMAINYDGWCEYGGVCHRFVSSYISETKGNAAYGDQDGAIGSYDVIVRNNLNGRQTRWMVALDYDSGPALSFTSSRMRCWEKNWLGPSTCGVHTVASTKISRGDPRHTSGIIYGNRLNNSDEYYSQFTSNFTPNGYPRYGARALNTPAFNCYGDDNCYFPQA